MINNLIQLIKTWPFKAIDIRTDCMTECHIRPDLDDPIYKQLHINTSLHYKTGHCGMGIIASGVMDCQGYIRFGSVSF
jgi:hypothetical protein